MASVPANKLSQQELAQLACTYASLILYDDGQDITADKLATLINSADVKVESFWPKLFAKAVAGQNIADFFNFGGASSSSSSPSPAVQTTTTSQPAAKTETKKDEKKKPKEEPKVEQEEEDVGMGGLFD